LRANEETTVGHAEIAEDRLAGERGDDRLLVEIARGARVDAEPVLAAERSRLGDRAELVLNLVDFGLDLRLVDARLAGRNEQLAHFLDGLDRAVHRRVGDVDRRSADPERVIDGRERLVVGAHGGREGPVGGAVLSRRDAEAGRDPVLRDAEVFVGLAEALESGLRGEIGIDAVGHSYAP